MINRIREIRQQKGLTLAELAAACAPPTTAQTIGRLETGTRNLSLKWMDRIAAALGIDPENLVRSETQERPKIVARLGNNETTALDRPREAILPHELASSAGGEANLVMQVEASAGDYRAGDFIWLRQIPIENAASVINRDCLVPRAGGRFVFGRLIDQKGTLIGILPVHSGQKQQVIDNPAWIASVSMLVRSL